MATEPRIASVVLLLGATLASACSPASREPARPTAPARALRVCADPNNLPFSSDREDGIENALARLVAGELDAELRYEWRPERRGFVRETLDADKCDAMMGVPTSLDRVLATAPYYRSTYVFVSRAKDGPAVRSFDDAALREVRVGVQMVGDDYANTPPAHALARRGVVQNVRGFSVFGDYSQPSPPARIVDAVASGDIDVAIAWGPMASYFASRESVALTVTPVAPEIDVPFLPFVFDISMGVKRGNTALKDELDRVITTRRADIDRILASFGVPRVDRSRT